MNEIYGYFHVPPHHEVLLSFSMESQDIVFLSHMKVFYRFINYLKNS